MRQQIGSLLRNIATNTASYLVTIGAAFLIFPAMVHNLGVARYGLWMLISEVTGYYSYVGLGIRAGVVFYAASYLAQGQTRELNRIVSTSIWALFGVGAVLALAGVGLASAFPSMFVSRNLDPQETYRSIIIMSSAVGLSLPLEAMNSVLTANKRLDIVSLIEMISRSVTSVAMLICVMQGMGLVPLSLLQLGAKMIILPCTYVAIRRTLPDVSLSVRFWNSASLLRLCRFGLPSLMIGLGWLAASRTDLIVAGMALGISTVAFYSVPRSLMEYADAGIRAIAWAFTSNLTHFHAQDQSEDMVRLYLRGARLTSLIVFLLAAHIAAFGTPFLLIWQGGAFVTGPLQRRSSVVLLILLVAFLPRLIQNMATQLFYATNRLNYLMWISLLEGAIKVVLSLILVRPYGLAGVAFSNVFPMLFFEGLAIPLYLFRTYPFHLRAYLRDVLGRPLLAGVPALLFGAALVQLRPPQHWPLFLFEASLTATVGFFSAMVFGTTVEDREAFRGSLVRLVPAASVKAR